MINIIAAIGRNRELGKDNDLLWHIPDDLKHFKKITKGHPIIMGRKTFESIGKPLPNRTNIVISHNAVATPGVVSVESLRKAFKLSSNECFVIGGAQIYQQALSLADTLYLTLIDATALRADAFFPEFESGFKKISEEKHVYENLKYAFTEWKRK